MEAHPVPKNVLTVEFKLFGSLTVRQFFKILGGCLVALLLFISPIPKIISLPAIVIIVLVSVLSALIKDFQVRFWGFMRSIFVSPQYVWKKETPAPSVLADDKQKQDRTKAKGAKSLLPAPVNTDDLMIDKLLAARSNQAKQIVLVENGEPEEQDDLDFQSNQNLERAYTEAFGATAKKAPAGNMQPMVRTDSLAGASMNGGERIGVGPSMQMAVNTLKGRKMDELPASEIAVPTAAQETTPQVEQAVPSDPLQAQMQQNMQANEVAAAQINQMYNQAHSAAQQEVPVENKEQEERQIYGLAVDRNEAPVSGATVSILDANNQVVAPTTTTGDDGRFALQSTQLPFGGYVIHLDHPKFKFYDFKINYEAGKLPAYKFRAQ